VICDLAIVSYAMGRSLEARHAAEGAFARDGAASSTLDASCDSVGGRAGEAVGEAVGVFVSVHGDPGRCPAYQRPARLSTLTSDLDPVAGHATTGGSITVTKTAPASDRRGVASVT